MAGLGSDKGNSKSILLFAAVGLATALIGYGCAGVVSATGSKSSSPQAVLTVSPTSATFQNVAAGSTSTQMLTISNTGTAQATISQINVNGTGFSVAGVSLPAYIPNGQQVSFSIMFSPSVAGNSSGSISVVSDAPNSPLTIAASGSAVAGPILTSSANTLSFGNVAVGSTSNLALNLTNTGTANLNISGVTVVGAGLSATGVAANSVLAPGQSATLTVTYAPTVAQNLTGSVSIASNAPNSPLMLPVNGTATPAGPSLISTASSLNFGSVVVGGTNSLGVTLTNNGTASVTISAVTMVGSGFTAAGISAGMVLTPGQSAPANVTFAPQAAGSVTGSLTITSNAPTLTIALLGNGGTASSHAVALTWDPSTSDVTGYNVYRAPADGSSPYEKLNNALQSETQFTDSAILAGQQYMYAVTSVDADGVESEYSDPAVADVP